MKFEITTPPTAEPVLLSEAKAQLRIDHDLEDDLINIMIGAARRKVEEGGRALLTQTIKAYWDAWPSECGYSLFLPMYPVASVTSVKYIDTDGNEQTWAADQYTADTVGMMPRVVPKPDVDIPDLGNYPNAITVEYVAGVATSSLVPDELKQAILQWVTLLYEYRSDMPLNNNVPGLRSADWLMFGSRSELI